MIRTVLFTKLFEKRPVEVIGAAAAELGFDGIDLLIRRGFTVAPDEPDGIGAAVRHFEGLGLEVPMATSDLTDPDGFSAEKVLGACADAGVGLVRLGYWSYDGSRPYADVLGEAQRHLDRLEQLARTYQVRLVIQLHGDTVHASGALTRVLLEGRDPELVGAYPDPGNQALQGGSENWQLTFELLEPWLTCVGVKNGGWFPAEAHPSGQSIWRSDWLGLADGMVQWHEILDHLARSKFSGLLSFHSHYERPYPQVLDQTRVDLAYVRRLLRSAA